MKRVYIKAILYILIGYALLACAVMLRADELPEAEKELTEAELIDRDYKKLKPIDYKKLGDKSYNKRRDYLFTLKALEADYNIKALIIHAVHHYHQAPDMETKLLCQELVEHYYFFMAWQGLVDGDDYYYGDRTERLRKAFRTMLEYYYQQAGIKTTLSPEHRVENYVTLEETNEDEYYYEGEEE